MSSHLAVDIASDVTIFSILVLKDGQIVEQGSHKELLAKDGVFAAMWADQISASEDPAISIQSAKPELSGYSAGPSASTEDVVAPPMDTEEVVYDIPPETQAEGDLQEGVVAAEEPTESQSLEFSEEPEPIVSPESEAEPPVAFPSSESATVQPLAFPSSEEAAEETVSPPDIQSEPESPVVAFPVSDDGPSTPQSAPLIPAGVTFGETNTPSRTGTPDPDAEPKRKRISSQNFQRLAKRISISTRRQGSVASIGNIIPGLKRDSSPRVSVDDAGGSSRGEGSLNDSPDASVVGDDSDKTKKRKKMTKKDRKKTM